MLYPGPGMARFRRARAPRAIQAGADERRAAARGLPSEVTGLAYGTGDDLPVSVEEALQCTAVAGALNVIAGRGCTLPLQRWRGVDELPAGAFLSHPEADSNLPLTVTIWHTLADMCLAGVGLLARAGARLSRGFRLVVRRIAPSRCAPRMETVPGMGLVTIGWIIDGIDFPERDVLAFSGPNPRGWCVDAARAIRTAAALETGRAALCPRTPADPDSEKYSRGRPARRPK